MDKIFIETACVKCKSSCEGGSTYVEGGETYQFCKTCTDILETFSLPTNIISIFLNPKQKDKAIFQARKNRIKGKSLWNNLNKDYIEIT